mgnify:CR=1 FL=1
MILKWRQNPSFKVSSILVMLLMVSGCRQQVATKLQGTWIGHPDTSQARNAREEEKYGKRASEAADSQQSSAQILTTDWEEYDVGIRFEFRDHQDLNMSLADGSEPISASWRVLETSPTGCMIEVVTPAIDGQDSKVIRHFELEFDEREGTCVGFLLTESGADRQLGSLYFSRDEN